MIFDCDGVLIDSELISAEVLLEELALIGVKADLPYFFENFLGRHFSAVASNVEGRTGLVLGPAFEGRYLERLLARFQADLKPMAGACELLTELRANYCVATNSKTVRVTTALQFAGLSELTGGRVFSGSMVEHGKPAPDLFQLAARRHGVAAADCIVIEDSDMGIAAAHAAGMPVWRFIGGSHYKSEHGSPARLLPVDREFDDLADLMQ